jgi:hypothetical protein
MSSTSEPLKLSFVPNVAPWFSGIISVLNAPLKKEVRADDIWKLYEEKYGNEPLVHITKGVPDVMDAAGKHGWRMGGVQVHSSLKRVVVVVSTVRNLLIPSSDVLTSMLRLVISGCSGQPSQGSCDSVHAKLELGARLRRIGGYSERLSIDSRSMTNAQSTETFELCSIGKFHDKADEESREMTTKKGAIEHDQRIQYMLSRAVSKY